MTSYTKGPNYKLKLARASWHFCLRFGLLGCPFLAVLSRTAWSAEYCSNLARPGVALSLTTSHSKLLTPTDAFSGDRFAQEHVKPT